MMSSSNVILGIDVGKNAGFYVSDELFDNGFLKLKNTIYYKNKAKKTTYNLSLFYDYVLTLVRQYKPSKIVCGIPVAYRNTIIAHSQQMGVLKLIAQQNNIEYHEVLDVTCKKKVIGHGNADKDDIMLWANINNEHTADAKMFVYYLRKK